MRVWNLNPSQVTEIVNSVSNKYDNNVITNRCGDGGTTRIPTTDFTLRGIKSKLPGTRRSSSGRALTSACWHVHRDVMIELFKAGATRIRSSMADYRGLNDFMVKYEATGHQNIGSMMYPAYMPELCDC